MPQKKCGLGFNCSAMMLQPGLEPGDCENYTTCGSVLEFAPDEEIELIRVQEEQEQTSNEQIRLRRETIRVTRHQAAKMMLVQRSPTARDSDASQLSQTVEAIANQLQQLQEKLASFQDEYIAPPGCEAHSYNVKRGGKAYWYNKLTATKPIFEPAHGTGRVCTIHLSHSDDPRNLEARCGVERRNKLSTTKTKLEEIQRQLGFVLADLELD